MAEIVLGLGSSHTPQLSTTAADWAAHAARDTRNSALLGADGRFHTYEELLEKADPAIAGELSEEIWTEKSARAQVAVEVLAEALAAAAPDVVVVVGDDQHEMFAADGVPAIGLYLGDELWDWPPEGERLERIPPDIRLANWAAHAEVAETYPVQAELSAHLAASLTIAGFDLTVLSEQREGRGIGHAFTFVRRRLHLAAEVPIVPVLLNTYFPPNVPPPGRCFELGRAIAAGIGSFPAGLRVAVFASGGLSHFVVLEEMDKALLAALERSDGEALAAIDRALLRSGTSECLNWIAAGGALGSLHFELVDYIPAYRSPAGTGVGMAFALWRPGDAVGNGPGGAARNGHTQEQGAAAR